MYNFFDPTRVLFGAGQLNHLHEQAMPEESNGSYFKW